MGSLSHAVRSAAPGDGAPERIIGSPASSECSGTLQRHACQRDPPAEFCQGNRFSLKGMPCCAKGAASTTSHTPPTQLWSRVDPCSCAPVRGAMRTRVDGSCSPVCGFGSHPDPLARRGAAVEAGNLPARYDSGFVRESIVPSGGRRVLDNDDLETTSRSIVPDRISSTMIERPMPTRAGTSRLHSTVAERR